MQTVETSATNQIERIRVRVLPDGRLSRADAARYLGRAKKTLEMWALQGQGPRSIRVGGRIFYFQRDLDAFIQSGATTEPAAA